MRPSIDTAKITDVLDHWMQSAHAVEAQLAAISDDGIEHLKESAAAMMWSILIEPGDRVAWLLINEYGYLDAINALRRYAAGQKFNDEWIIQSLGSGQPIHDAMARWETRLVPERFEQVVRSAASLGMSVVKNTAPCWPQRVDRLGEHAPIVVWTLGNPQALNVSSVAYVGARAATAYGEHVTAELVSATASDGIGVISGGAYGIDGAAHRAALQAEVPTVAVLAGGLDRLYPRGHTAMLETIAKSGGVLIAEVPPATSPTRWRFLQRNRLIAALAEAVVVVEAGFRSGALNTAHHAMELGIPVGAVPGPVTSSQSAGCHRLFKEGLAACVTSGADVLELAGLAAAQTRAKRDALTDEARRVLDALSDNQSLPDHIVAMRSGCSAVETAAALGQLELTELVVRQPSGWMRVNSRA